jgi:hypothetical protein
LKLYDYQKRSADTLIRAIQQNGAALDASDCGTGKTPVACEIVRRANVGTFVVGPKSAKPTWERWAREIGTEVDFAGYEITRLGRTPFGFWYTPERGRKERWKWHPAIQFLIFDEGHRCGGIDSDNAELMMAARRQNIPALVLSATPAESPLRMRALGFLLRLHDGDENPNTLRNIGKNILPFWSWARRHGCRKGLFGFEFGGSREAQLAHMDKINNAIFPNRGTRVRISELGDAFPETMIRAELMDLGDAEKLAKLYVKMEHAIAALRERTAEYDQGDPLAAALLALQEVELLKVPAMCELVEDLVAGGKSVALFVRFKQTLEELRRRLGCDCYVDGSQVGEAGARQRAHCVEQFAQDRERIILANEAAGSESLSMHDIRGVYPREALFSCGFSAMRAKQLMGRVHRAGGKSRSVQRFLFAANTIEENCWKALNRKLSNMGKLLGELEDSDFSPFDNPGLLSK